MLFARNILKLTSKSFIYRRHFGYRKKRQKCTPFGCTKINKSTGEVELIEKKQQPNSFWEKVVSCVESKDKKKPKPPPQNTVTFSDEHCVTEEEYQQMMSNPEPEICEVKGKIYPTCNPHTFVIRREYEMPYDKELSREEKFLKNIENHHAMKFVEDPMPPFESVEKRLIDLADKGLHPYYKMFMSIPTQSHPCIRKEANSVVYHSKSGSFTVDEIPQQLKFNKELLDKKNLYADVKRVEPPMHLVNKVIEINRNRKPTMEDKIKMKQKKDAAGKEPSDKAENAKPAENPPQSEK